MVFKKNNHILKKRWALFLCLSFFISEAHAQDSFRSTLSSYWNWATQSMQSWWESLTPVKKVVIAVVGTTFGAGTLLSFLSRWQSKKKPDPQNDVYTEKDGKGILDLSKLNKNKDNSKKLTITTPATIQNGIPVGLDNKPRTTDFDTAVNLQPRTFESDSLNLLPGEDTAAQFQENKPNVTAREIEVALSESVLSAIQKNQNVPKELKLYFDQQGWAVAAAEKIETLFTDVGGDEESFLNGYINFNHKSVQGASTGASLPLALLDEAQREIIADIVLKRTELNASNKHPIKTAVTVENAEKIKYLLKKPVEKQKMPDGFDPIEVLLGETTDTSWNNQIVDLGDELLEKIKKNESKASITEDELKELETLETQGDKRDEDRYQELKSKFDYAKNLAETSKGTKSIFDLVGEATQSTSPKAVKRSYKTGSNSTVNIVQYATTIQGDTVAGGGANSCMYHQLRDTLVFSDALTELKKEHFEKALARLTSYEEAIKLFSFTVKFDSNNNPMSSYPNPWRQRILDMRLKNTSMNVDLRRSGDLLNQDEAEKLFQWIVKTRYEEEKRSKPVHKYISPPIFIESMNDIFNKNGDLNEEQQDFFPVIGALKMLAKKWHKPEPFYQRFIIGDMYRSGDTMSGKSGHWFGIALLKTIIKNAKTGNDDVRKLYILTNSLGSSKLPASLVSDGPDSQSPQIAALIRFFESPTNGTQDSSQQFALEN